MAAARMKLAIKEPRISLRIPSLQCIVEVTGASKHYSRLGVVNGVVDGEKVAISLREGGIIHAKRLWLTDFPETVTFGAGADKWAFIGAKVLGEELLVDLLRLERFTPADLAELANSSIPEVRAGAAANLRDRVVLARLRDDPIYVVRDAAIKGLTHWMPQHGRT
jgi:hypothetical protein